MEARHRRRPDRRRHSRERGLFYRRRGAEPGSATPPTTLAKRLSDTPPQEVALAPAAGLDAIVPAAIWTDCKLQTVPQPDAIETAVCVPPRACRTAGRSPPTGAAPSSCNAFAWGGELQWLHGRDKPGGRTLCYFDGNSAVIVWTHERLGQLTHRDVPVTAREGGSDHVGLTRWWRPWHHLIGKAQ